MKVPRLPAAYAFSAFTTENVQAMIQEETISGTHGSLEESTAESLWSKDLQSLREEIIRMKGAPFDVSAGESENKRSKEIPIRYGGRNVWTTFTCTLFILFVHSTVHWIYALSGLFLHTHNQCCNILHVP